MEVLLPSRSDPNAQIVWMSVILIDYNEFRPHSALTYLTPAEFARKSGSEAV